MDAFESPVGVRGSPGEKVGNAETTGQLRFDERDELREETGEDIIAMETDCVLGGWGGTIG